MATPESAGRSGHTTTPLAGLAAIHPALRHDTWSIAAGWAPRTGVQARSVLGAPIQLANALLSQAPVLRALGEHTRAAEARSILEYCPDPGIPAGRLAALGRPPQIRHVRSAEQELTQQELRVLKLLHGELFERDISRELYVAHNTVHSHVRAIYRKFAVSSRADALQRGRERGLL